MQIYAQTEYLTIYAAVSMNQFVLGKASHTHKQFYLHKTSLYRQIDIIIWVSKNVKVFPKTSGYTVISR